MIRPMTMTDAVVICAVYAVMCCCGFWIRWRKR